MIRLSVTHLDTFRYWRESEDELPALVARLTGEEPPTPQMLASRAFHSWLENASPCETHAAVYDGFRFDFAIDAELALPPIRELKAECVVQTAVGPVTLVGKVDALDGLTVRDYKLSERFDAERYTESYQWRSYLMMFGAKRFIYDVFQARYDADRVYVYDYHQLAFAAYPGMEADVQHEVEALAEVVVRHVPQLIMPEGA